MSPLKGAVCATSKEKFKGFCLFLFLRFQVQSQACWGQHFKHFPCVQGQASSVSCVSSDVMFQHKLQTALACPYA